MLKSYSLAIAVTLLSSGIAIAGQNDQGGFATTAMEAKIYRLDPLPREADGAVSGWLYTFVAPDIYFNEGTLDDNMKSNTRKFCAGGEWKLLSKHLEAHRIEFAFACYDQKAAVIRDAAVAQGIPAVTLR